MNVVEAERSHGEELQELQRPPRTEKVAEVERIEGMLKESASVFLTDFRGIDVEMMNDLRGRFREADVQFKIVKNNLLIRAADKADLPGWVSDLVGPTAMASHVADPVAPARVIKSFQDDHRRRGDFLTFKGGLLEGEVIEKPTFDKLASLPGREELIGKLLYVLSSPIQGLLNVLSGVPRSLVYALEDMRKKRESGEIAGPAAEETVPPVEDDVAVSDEDTTDENASAETADAGDDESEEVKSEETEEGDASVEEPVADAPAEGSEEVEEIKDADSEETAE
ncbi:50S ribosomal protein L10 [Candidatus Zixiibacteriota bacterium]